MPFLAPLIPVVAGAIATYGAMALTVASDIAKPVASVLSITANTINDIIDPIAKAMRNVTDIVSELTRPVMLVLNSVAGLASDIEKNLINPIIGPIEQAISVGENLKNEFHQDLNTGLAGLVKIPGDLAGALTSLDSVFARQSQVQAAANKNTAENIIAPAIGDAAKGPLSDLGDKLTENLFVQFSGAEFVDLVNLDQSEHLDDVGKWWSEFLNHLKDAKGFWGDIEHVVYEILFMADFFISNVEQRAHVYSQLANLSSPTNLLGPGETIEAERRGIVSTSQRIDELKRQGLNESRQKVMYDLSQFLFGPSEAIKLFWRGIIPADVLTGLMNQNNLDESQTRAMQELMGFWFSPADAARLFYRGFIGDTELARYMLGNGVQGDQFHQIMEAELAPVRAAEAMLAEARIDASQHGFETESLISDPSEEIKQLYRKQSLSPEQAKLDWIMHWKVPPPTVYVTAYFRGLIDLNTVYQSFEQGNIPREAWDMIIGTERDIPPVWLIPDVLGSGAMSREQSMHDLGRLGYDEDDAKILTDYGLSKNKTSKATTASSIHGLSLHNAYELWFAGAIDDQEYKALLMSHGLGKEAAALTMEAESIAVELANRKNQAERIIAMVQSGIMTFMQAQDELANLGYSAGEMSKYVVQLEAAYASHRKMPSPGQYKLMWTKGVITEAQYLEGLVTSGYSVEWAQRVIDSEKA